MRRSLLMGTFVVVLVIGAFASLRPNNQSPPVNTTVPRCTSDCTVIRESSVGTRKGGVTFEFPKSYIRHFDQTRWEPEPNRWETELQVKWPSMAPFTMDEIDGLFKEWDKSGRAPGQGNFLVDLLSIRIRQNAKTPVPITASALEAVVVSRYGAPKPLTVIPGVQEYGENPRELAYRDLTGEQRFADGMPTYIFCRGKSLVIAPDDLKGGCLVQLTWPNGLEVDLRFNRVHLPKWRQLHDAGIGLIQTFIVDGGLPSGSLLKVE